MGEDGSLRRGGRVMNSWQRLVVVVGLLASLGLALFPPTCDKRLDGFTSSTRHSFLFGNDIRQILWRRLAVEEAMLWAPTVVLILLLRKRRPAEWP